MNALKNLDKYVSRKWPVVPRSTDAGPSSTTGARDRSRSPANVPESILSFTEPIPESPRDDEQTSDPNLPSTTIADRGRRLQTKSITTSNVTFFDSPNLKRKRRPGYKSSKQRQEKQKKELHKRRRIYKSKGWMGGAYVAVLALWGSLWGTVFGDTDRMMKELRRNLPVKAIKPEQEQGIEGSSDRPGVTTEKSKDGSASESEPSDKSGDEADAFGRHDAEQVGNEWQDPVTRPPATETELLKQAEETANVPPPRQAQERANVGHQRQQLSDPTVSFQLPPYPPCSSSSTPADTDARPTDDPSPKDEQAMVTTVVAPSRKTKLLPNPMSPRVLTKARKQGPDALSASSPGTQALSASPGVNDPHRHPSPRPPLSTPFHRPKTLILDLDETLIHSTSRPINIQSSGVGGGGGLVGINLSGLFGGSQRRGGGGRSEGHTVEVVLGGRSTLYHVYKRPYVDHFLKKVRTGWVLDTSFM